MEALLFVGLVMVAVLFLVAAAWRFRLMGDRPRVPPWLPALVLAIAIAGLVAAIVRGSWLSVASFALLTVLWSIMLFTALRARRSDG